MLKFNGKLYALTDAEYQLASKDEAEQLNGFYKRDNGGIKLYDERHTLCAYVVIRPGNRFVVTAHTLEPSLGGRDRFMFGMSDITARWVGMDPKNLSTRAEHEAIAAIEEFGYPRNPVRDWVIHSPFEYEMNDRAGFWSNDDGWTTLEGATRFSREEVQGPLPLGAQTLRIGTMKDFRLMLAEHPNDPRLDQTPILFQCFASDMDHATRQADKAYPGCKVLGTEDDVAQEQTVAPCM